MTQPIQQAVENMARAANGLANELDATAVLLAQAFGLPTPRMYYTSSTAGTIPAALDNLETQLSSVAAVCDAAAERLHGLTRGRPAELAEPAEVHVNGTCRPHAAALALHADAPEYPDGTFADDAADDLTPEEQEREAADARAYAHHIEQGEAEERAARDQVVAKVEEAGKDDDYPPADDPPAEAARELNDLKAAWDSTDPGATDSHDTPADAGEPAPEPAEGPTPAARRKRGRRK